MLLPYTLVMAAIYNLLLAVIILQRTRPGQVGRKFVWFLCWYAIWIGCGALLLHPGTSGTGMDIWVGRLAFFCATISTISWLWFCQGFPFPSPRFRRLTWALSAPTPVWLVLVWTPLIIPAPVGAHWNPHTAAGLLQPLFGLWLIACLAISTAHLAVKARRSRGLQRLQVTYILLGFIPAMLIALVCNLIIPAITGSLDYIQFGLLATLLFTSSTTYALARYRLMDTRVALHSTLAYMLTAGMLTILYWVAVPVITRTLANRFSLPYQMFGSLYALSVAILFHPLRRLLHGLLDKLFHKAHGDYRLTLREASNAFASAYERDQVVRMLIGSLVNTFWPRDVAIYLPGEEGALRLASSPEPWSGLPSTIALTDPLIAYAADTDDVLVADKLRYHPYRHADLAEQMTAWDVQVVVPLVAGGRVCGVTFLAHKSSGDLYLTDDIALLRILGKQAALALDNAEHHESLRVLNQQLEQRVVERTRALREANQRLEEVNTALEAERAYLSAAIDILPLPMMFVTPESHCIRSNRAMEEFLQGCSLTDKDTFRFLDSAMHAPIPQEEWPIFRALRGEVAALDEGILILPDGRAVPIIAHAGPIRVGDRLVAAVGAFQDITALKAADQAKDRFLAVLSHELKTPLTCIMAWTEVAQHTADPQVVDKSLHIIEQNTHRQRRLLEDLLDVSRIIHEKLSINLEPTDLWSLAEQAADNLLQTARERGIALQSATPGMSLPVQADPERLLQVIHNLLNNALKFTPAGGAITLSASVRDEYACLSVTDTGTGIPAEMLPLVFKPFQQLEQSAAHGGLGLGLALVKGIVELHGGYVTASSAGNGQGSTFTIALPLASVYAETSHAVVATS